MNAVATTLFVAPALITACALAISQPKDTPKPKITVSAPVVSPPAGGAMHQTGKYTYEFDPAEGVVVLFCIRKPTAKSMACMIYVNDEDGAYITMVDGVRPTEENT